MALDDATARKFFEAIWTSRPQAVAAVVLMALAATVWRVVSGF